MIRQELKELNTSARELRKFGLLVGGIFLLLGAWFFWRGKPAFPFLFAAGGPLFFLGLVWPRALRVVYVGWMTLALLLGLVVSTLLLTLFFYLVVTPIGLFARLVGKDFLSRKW